SMVAQKALGEETPFMADLSQVNFKDDYALLWHDGVAPCNLWDKVCNRSLETYFAGGKGVTADFVLKSGDVSILRIDTARGETRIFYEEGEAVPMDKLLSGTYAKVIFDRPIKDIIDTVVYTGVAHHCIMAYVKSRDAIKHLSRITGWKIL
nr:fucose isomerase [Gammaproteobacteria bacterium]